MCTWQNSPFELDTFAPSILHPLAIIALPIHLLAAYVILFKTPKTMGSVKQSMLALHLCGAYLDLFFSAFSTQYVLLPAGAGYSIGLYTHLGIPVKWQFYMLIVSICLTGDTVLGFFECRYNAIVRGDSGSLFRNTKRLLYIGVHCVFSVVFILPITLNPPDQELGKNHVRNVLPCLPNHILEHPDLFVFATDITLLSVLVAIPSVAIPTECVFFAVKIAIFLSATRAKSKKTHKLQMQFFIALCIQVSIPMLALTVPDVYIVYSFSQGYFNQALNNILINMMALHGIISSIVMLTVHKPYRQAVYNMFLSRFFARCSRFTKPKSKSSNTSQVGPVDATFVIVSEYNTR